MGATTSAGDTKDTPTYENPDAGNYVARCIQVVELGTQHVPANKYNSEPKDQKQILIVWELAELMQDGRPFTVNNNYNNLISEKSSLCKMLESWRSKPFTPEERKRFDLGKILDVGCMVNIVKAKSETTGKEYVNVKSVTPLPKGIKPPERVNQLVNFGISDLGTPEFEKLWPWVQKKIMNSKEGIAFLEKQEQGGEADDLPFDMAA